MSEDPEDDDSDDSGGNGGGGGSQDPADDPDPVTPNGGGYDPDETWTWETDELVVTEGYNEDGDWDIINVEEKEKGKSSTAGSPDPTPQLDDDHVDPDPGSPTTPTTTTNAGKGQSSQTGKQQNGQTGKGKKDSSSKARSGDTVVSLRSPTGLPPALSRDISDFGRDRGRGVQGTPPDDLYGLDDAIRPFRGIPGGRLPSPAGVVRAYWDYWYQTTIGEADSITDWASQRDADIAFLRGLGFLLSSAQPIPDDLTGSWFDQVSRAVAPDDHFLYPNQKTGDSQRLDALNTYANQLMDFFDIASSFTGGDNDSDDKRLVIVTAYGGALRQLTEQERSKVRLIPVQSDNGESQSEDSTNEGEEEGDK